MGLFLGESFIKLSNNLHHFQTRLNETSEPTPTPKPEPNPNPNPPSTNIDPATLKFGDRIDNKATVVGTFESRDLGTVVYAVLDAQYRGVNIKWASGLQETDTGLPNYLPNPPERYTESATYNTDYILNNYSDKATEAFTFCRNAGNLTFNGKTYNYQLPNAYELLQIYKNRKVLDTLDTTAEANSTKKLSKWGFGSEYAQVWSSSESSNNCAWLLTDEGGSYEGYKYYNSCGIIPIIEIPISNNTPSEETSKEFTITSNASNATILVDEVQ